MKVLVTGANGFIGSHLVKSLLKKGYQVKAFVRTTSKLNALQGLDVELAYGDILQPDTLTAALKDCKLLFHVAGIYTYWGYGSAEMVSHAKQGMQNIMEAVSKSKVKRVILTSSSVIFGSTKQKRTISVEQPGDFEDDPAYVRSKVEQEKLALRLADLYHIDLLEVNPTLTVGGLDYGLTESNHMIVSYLKDPFKTTWPGGCNIVSVEDVADGHIMAAEKGNRGEKYILGSENLEWRDVHSIISELSGLPGPQLTAYHTSAFLASAFYEMMSFFSGETPSSSREQAKMVGQYYWYDYGKICNLGYAPKPAKAALTEAVSWLATSEHIPASVRATMKLSPQIYTYRNGI